MSEYVAFFIDGNFLFRRMTFLKAFFLTGPAIREYCARHLVTGEKLFDIFYYDSEPLTHCVKNPATGKDFDFRKTETAVAVSIMLDGLRHTMGVTLRLSKPEFRKTWAITDQNSPNILRPCVYHRGLNTTLFGIDVTRIALKHQVQRMVFITDDVDAIIPACDLTRSEGIHITLDSLAGKVPDIVLDHVNETSTEIDVDEVMAKRRHYLVMPGKAL